jgi:BirA family biotin operon repressor/biotin-[acetyl-CoA-carboxylase] ligase
VSAAPILTLDETDSTNAEASRRAEAGERGPLWITARRQTAGRGRRGRAWSSESGNLAATLLMTTNRPPVQAAQITFVAALAVADLIDAFTVGGGAIKWPNDVLIDGAKASGILVESGPHPEGGLWLAIGIGVNLAHHPEDTERPSTSIAAHLRPDIAYPPSAESALSVLAEAFAEWQGRWDTLGFAPVLEAWKTRAFGLDGPCVARLGHETLTGMAEGVEDDGALRLRLADGALRKIAAGDVFFGEAA